MKTTKKTFIAVSMIGFAAMMFSCAGTNKNAPAAQEATSAVQEQLDRVAQPGASAETPAEENLSEQNALQSENSSAAQEAVPQNNDVSAPAAE